LQGEYELLAEQPGAARPESVRVRMALLRQIAEEAGDLKQAVMIVPVRHQLVGVDLDALR